MKNINWKRLGLAFAAVIALVAGIILLGGNNSASAAERNLCSSTYYRIATDTPRSTFFEIYGDRGTRVAYTTRGQMIRVQTETRQWIDCGVKVTFKFVKVGSNPWTLA